MEVRMTVREVKQLLDLLAYEIARNELLKQKLKKEKSNVEADSKKR